jgi:hypothetical protein
MPTNLARILDTDREKPQVTRDLFDEIPDSNTITKDHLQIGQSEILRLTDLQVIF